MNKIYHTRNKHAQNAKNTMAKTSILLICMWCKLIQYYGWMHHGSRWLRTHSNYSNGKDAAEWTEMACDSDDTCNIRLQFILLLGRSRTCEMMHIIIIQLHLPALYNKYVYCIKIKCHTISNDTSTNTCLMFARNVNKFLIHICNDIGCPIAVLQRAIRRRLQLAFYCVG